MLNPRWKMKEKTVKTIVELREREGNEKEKKKKAKKR